MKRWKRAAVIAGIAVAQLQTKWEHNGNIYVPIWEYIDTWFCYFVTSVLPPTLHPLSLETSVGLGLSLVCCLFACLCLLLLLLLLSYEALFRIRSSCPIASDHTNKSVQSDLGAVKMIGSLWLTERPASNWRTKINETKSMTGCTTHSPWIAMPSVLLLLSFRGGQSLCLAFIE